MGAKGLPAEELARRFIDGFNRPRARLTAARRHRERRRCRCPERPSTTEHDMSLSGKTIFISGASRGIGLAIALRAARDGANVALIAKTAEPHPKLEGTVYTAAEQIEAAGGQALPIVGDIRDEAQVAAAVEQAVERFGGIDVCVNNASAINLARTEALDMKRYDLMQDINVRGTFAVSRACIPHLRGRENPHVLTLSPPLDLDPRWLGPHLGYTLAKYGMSLIALGLAAELRADGIASNALWPRTLVATAAVQNLLGGDEAMARARRPEVYADAAYAILNRPSRECTGNAFLCEDVLVEEGITDLSPYSYVPGADLAVDLFVDAVNPPGVSA
jgi:citronellol/citronellal dehydrogenase